MLLGPRLIGAMGEDSQHWQEAEKVDMTALANENSALQVVARLKGIRGTVAIQEAVSKWRELTIGMSRFPREGPKKQCSRFDIHVTKVGEALHAAYSDIEAETFMCLFLLGTTLLEGTHLEPTENAALLATSGKSGHSQMHGDI